MIKMLKPRLRSLAPLTKTRRQLRDTRHGTDKTVRGWYKSKRWQDLRELVLERDLYTCRQTGVLLLGKVGAPDSPVVDHIIPHRGDERLFFDPSNCQAVSKSWHDSIKRSEDLKFWG